MKRVFQFLAVVVLAAMVSSCATISTPIAATSHPVGSKCGEATSITYLGLFTKDGEVNGINKAAKQAGITKISHVDAYTTNYFFGIIQKQTTKVYGE